MPPGHGLMQPMRPPTTPRWLDHLLWRLRRWAAYRSCVEHQRHVEVENQIENRRTGTHVRVRWCPVCCRITWID
jgi:hypothetical protein